MGMQYEYYAWEKEAKEKRMTFWKRLRECRADFLEDNPEIQHINSNNGFYYHMQDKYGIKIHFDNAGNIQQTFDIVDKNKYLIFLMKYASE